jgi:hypothetical protein
MPKPHGCSWKRYPPEDRTPQFYIVLFLLCLFVMIFGFICVNEKDESPKDTKGENWKSPKQRIEFPK